MPINKPGLEQAVEHAQEVIKELSSQKLQAQGEIEAKRRLIKELDRKIGEYNARIELLLSDGA